MQNFTTIMLSSFPGVRPAYHVSVHRVALTPPLAYIQVVGEEYMRLQTLGSWDNFGAPLARTELADYGHEWPTTYELARQCSY